MVLLDSVLIVSALALGVVAAPGRPPVEVNRHDERRGVSVYMPPEPTQHVTEWETWRPSRSSQYTQQSPSGTTILQSSTQSPTGTITSIAPTTSLATTSAVPSGPCASVSELAAAYTNAHPSAVARVPAQLAYECLNTIPFNQTAAEQYLNSIDPYIKWQTTLQYLRDPPAEYVQNVQPAYDFDATWAAIKANTSANAYQSEYEFGWTVYRAAQLAHDGHFVFYPDSVTSIFSFGRLTPLVSVSLDGVEKPQPYVYADVLASSGGAPFTPSAITQIDGQDAVDYLLVWSEYGSLQDPDALWNNLFYEPAQIALGTAGTGTGTFSGGGRGRWPYPGPSTTLTFANGTSSTFENFARVLLPFDNVTSGADIYNLFLTPPPEAYENAFEYASSTLVSTSTSTSAATSAPATATPTSVPAPGYPTPFVSETNNLNGGYFIDAPGYEDVAVLVVRSFVGTTDDEIPFQSVNTYFIETAAAMGKTKLIIDVSANGGGTILQGYDLFKQLFPSILPYGATRFRAHDAFNLLGEQSSYLGSLLPRSLNNSATFEDIQSSAFDYHTDADVNYEPFYSWPEKYGPDVLGPGPDDYTSIIRWNLSDVLTPLNSGGIYVSGYLNRSNITTQPFAAENIIILTDGYCASTCTIFSELMRQQGGVKTVTLGGRPTKEGITQAVGGVKGTNDFEFAYIFEVIAEVFGASNTSLQNTWENTPSLSEYTALPLYRSTAVVVNSRNGYRQGDSSNTPLQFVYEPADCRILYTPAMVVDETAVWKTVTDSVWGGGAGNACIAGGFGAAAAKDRKKQRSTPKSKRTHAVRSDLDYRSIFDSFDVQTETGSKKGGDSIMIP